MNFTEFSFWWLLLTVGAPLLIAREVAIRLRRWRYAWDPLVLFIISSVLFWSAAPTSFTIHIIELLINYAVLRSLSSLPKTTGRLLAGLAIALDLSVLAYFKYADFLLHDVLHVAVATTALPRTAGLPPGISFYTFQVVAFMIDSVRSRDQEPVGLLDYLNFASFFPLVVAGPIERRADLLPQMETFRWKYFADNLDAGLRWIAAGAFVKFVLADNLNSFVKIAEVTNPWIVLSSMYLFGLRIYFDFAGYSFIALGLGRLVGVTLTVNFLAPYSSSSIGEFWRRWHVTLSQWFRDYVYIPLGGSRTGLVAFNLLVVFVISGVWHGAGWNYVIWGAYHGLLLIVSRSAKPWVRMPRVVGWLLTFNAVMLGWLLFMETNFERLAAKLRILTAPAAYSLSNLHAAVESYSVVDRMSLLLSLTIATAVLLIEWRGTYEEDRPPYEFLLRAPAAMTLLGLTLLLGARSFSAFVYFAF